MKFGRPVITRKEILWWVILSFGLFYSTETLAWGLWGKKEKETGDYLVQKKGDSSVCVVHEGKKYYIPPDMLEFLGYGSLPVKSLSPKKFDAMPYGEDEWLEIRMEQILSSRSSSPTIPTLPEGLQEGSLIKREGDYIVYIIHDGKKYPVKDRKVAEERGYSLSDAQVLSPTLFNSIPEGEEDYLSTISPIDKVYPPEKYYDSYEEVFRGSTNPYKEDHTGYNYPYPVSSEQLYGGEFKRFEEKIFGNVRDNILSPRELEERKRLEEEAELRQRYLEEQIRYQQEQTRQLENYYGQNNNSYTTPATEVGTPLSSSTGGTVETGASSYPSGNVSDTLTSPAEPVASVPPPSILSTPTSGPVETGTSSYPSSNVSDTLTASAQPVASDSLPPVTDALIGTSEAPQVPMVDTGGYLGEW